MSSETRSPADTAFERRLLESARGDAQPQDVEQAWALFASGLGAVLPEQGVFPGRLPTHVATGGAAGGASAASAMKWLLVGAIAGSGLTGALLMGRRLPSVARPAVERIAGPVPRAAEVAPLPVLPPRPPAERKAPRPLSHHLVHASASVPHAATPTSALAAEVSRIDTARVAIASGDYDEAMGLIARYHDDFPGGALAPDADVVALEAAAAKHDRTEVARRAASFLARYPNDPHTARVEWLAKHPGPR